MFNCDCCGICCRNVGKEPSMREYDRGDGVCKHLNKENKCNIYEQRPLICNVQKVYERFFKDKMSIDVFFKMNENACKQLKQMENK